MSSTNKRLTHNDHAILSAIRQIRERHRCCAMQQVAIVCGFSRSFVIERMEDMRKRGLVAWSHGVVGSIHIVGEADPVTPQPELTEKMRDTLLSDDLTEDEIRLLAEAARAGETILPGDPGTVDSDAVPDSVVEPAMTP